MKSSRVNLNLRYFTLGEFDCQVTGENSMESEFLEVLDEIRHRCGFPFIITSGYRDPSHPAETVKAVPGNHTKGIAADIKITNSAQRYAIVKHAMDIEVSGIGIASNFVHLDIRATTPVIWLY